MGTISAQAVDQGESEADKPHSRPNLRPVLTDRFETLFSQLRTAFVEYDDAARTVEDVRALAEMRLNLDKLRWELYRERQFMRAAGLSEL